MSKASAASGLVYVYEYPSEEQVIYPDGTACVGVLGGIVAVRDTR